MDLELFNKEIEENGWCIFHDVISMESVENLRLGLDKACEETGIIRKKNKIEFSDEMAHHLPQKGNVFYDYLLNLPLQEYLKAYFEGNYMLFSFGGNKNYKSLQTHAHAIHRDIRTFNPEKLMLNTMILLDDFTEENGATHMLTGSHKDKSAPTSEHFYEHSERVIAKAGSIVAWNTNLFHAAGHNKTDGVRRIVSPIFSVPWKKPLFDYPRYLGYDLVDELDEHGKQIFGYNARVPASMEEWYQLPENRLYKSGQG